MVTITEFTDLRELILKNAIYNRILTSILSDAGTFCVASTLKNLKPETKEILKKDTNRNRLPTYALYDILIEINDDYFAVGIRYPTHPVIWEYPKVSLKNLKELAMFIYSKYSINASKSDKIFSAIPLHVKLFLNDNEYSSNFWRLGFSKKVKWKEHEELDNKKIENYLLELKRRNAEYRAFNTILINLLRKNAFIKNKPGFGSISVKPSIFKHKPLVIFDSELDYKTYTDIFPIYAFNPVMWNTIDSDIDKEILAEIIR